jgi:hypothetical protein
LKKQKALFSKKSRSKHANDFFTFQFIDIAVSIVVLNSQNNAPIPNTVISVNGTNQSAPADLGTMVAGTVLDVIVAASGFITETRTVIVSNEAGNLRQQVTFNLSPVLVNNFCCFNVEMISFLFL